MFSNDNKYNPNEIERLAYIAVHKIPETLRASAMCRGGMDTEDLTSIATLTILETTRRKPEKGPTYHATAGAYAVEKAISRALHLRSESKAREISTTKELKDYYSHADALNVDAPRAPGDDEEAFNVRAVVFSAADAAGVPSLANVFYYKIITACTLANACRAHNVKYTYALAKWARVKDIIREGLLQ